MPLCQVLSQNKKKKEKQCFYLLKLKQANYLHPICYISSDRLQSKPTGPDGGVLSATTDHLCIKLCINVPPS